MARVARGALNGHAGQVDATAFVVAAGLDRDRGALLLYLAAAPSAETGRWLAGERSRGAV